MLEGFSEMIAMMMLSFNVYEGAGKTYNICCSYIYRGRVVGSHDGNEEEIHDNITNS